MKINTGLKDKELQDIVQGLSRLLADTYTLYLKTQNFHWNVTGPRFQPLHQVFEEQYEELAEAIDEIAERIRALGSTTPATFAQFLELASIKEERMVSKDDKMISLLLEGHELIIRAIRSLLPLTEPAGDEATADLLAGRLAAHEKTAWMLRSFLAN